MRSIYLSEGTYTIDKEKQFTSYKFKEHIIYKGLTGSILVEIQPFVVITSKDVLLMDTGLGFTRDGQFQLHRNLAAAGINVSDITKVLLSHLHKDHAGGAGVEREGLGQSLSIPGATYYVQRAELAYAFEKGFPSFTPEDLECLRNNRQVELLEGNGFIDDYIEYAVTGAHSPFHQVFWIRDEGETVFYGADDAPQLQQMKHRFVAKYDHDGKKAMELRQQWWQQGEKEKWTFLFYHDVKNPVWKF